MTYTDPPDGDTSICVHPEGSVSLTVWNPAEIPLNTAVPSPSLLLVDPSSSAKVNDGTGLTTPPEGVNACFRTRMHPRAAAELTDALELDALDTLDDEDDTLELEEELDPTLELEELCEEELDDALDKLLDVRDELDDAQTTVVRTILLPTVLYVTTGPLEYDVKRTEA